MEVSNLNITTGEKLYALDIETSGLDRFKDHLLCIGIYSPNFSRVFDNLTDFNSWLGDNRNAVFVAHSGSFDFGFIRHNGLDLRNRWIADTRTIASTLIPRPLSLGLEPLAKEFLGYESYKLDRTKMADYSKAELSNYCLTDCRYTYELYEYLIKHTDGLFVRNWIMPATQFCADMEYDGVWVDKPGLQTYSDLVTAKRDSLLQELQDLTKPARMAYHELQVREVSKTYKELHAKAKEKTKDKEKCLRRYALLESAAVSRLEAFNWNSPKQLIWMLKEYYSLVLENRDGEDSTAEAVIRSIDHPVCKKLCDYRETEKLVSTCIPALLENIALDGFIHPHYHIGGTRTGRLSCSGPNLQQIPRGPIRNYVQASDRARVLVTIDYSQIEVRIIAELAKESELINAFKEEIDPYSIIAHKLLKVDAPIKEIKTRFKKERDVAKTAGLSILYGTGAGKLQEVLKKELGRTTTVQECKQFIQDYRNSLPRVRDFKELLERKLSNKAVYKNLLGRPFIIDSNEDLYMQALNTLVQGSASDMVMHSAYKVKEKLDMLGVYNKCRLLIHDEQVWELAADEAKLLVEEVIEPAMTIEIQKELGLVVPLKVEYNIGRQWEKP